MSSRKKGGRQKKRLPPRSGPAAPTFHYGVAPTTLPSGELAGGTSGATAATTTTTTTAGVPFAEWALPAAATGYGLPGSVTAFDLAQQAEIALESLELDQAVALYVQALQLEPENADIMDDLAAVLLDLGQDDKARQVLQRSIEVAPESNHAKYMNMGQLSGGTDALACYRKGVELLNEQRVQAERGRNRKLARQLGGEMAAALCAAAELFLTDCCELPEAEAECERLLTTALQLDADSVEALQLLASTRLSQSRPEEALALMQRSYTLWRGAPADQRPPFAFRESTARVLLELGQHAAAAEVCEGLLEEDDEAAQIWYMLATAYVHVNTWNAEEALQSGLANYAKIQMQLPELEAAMQEMLARVSEQNKTNPIGEPEWVDDDGGGAGGDGDDDGGDDDDDDDDDDGNDDGSGMQPMA